MKSKADLSGHKNYDGDVIERICFRISFRFTGYDFGAGFP